jgi:hypothetical protein
MGSPSLGADEFIRRFLMLHALLNSFHRTSAVLPVASEPIANRAKGAGDDSPHRIPFRQRAEAQWAWKTEVSAIS